MIYYPVLDAKVEPDYTSPNKFILIINVTKKSAAPAKLLAFNFKLDIKLVWNCVKNLKNYF